MMLVAFHAGDSNLKINEFVIEGNDANASESTLPMERQPIVIDIYDYL
jgi:hypothetical protein